MNQNYSLNKEIGIVTSTSPSKLLGMSWVHFLNDGSANFLPGILPAVLLALGLPINMAGVIMSSLLIGQAFQPFMGLLADKIGGRKLLFIGLASSTLGGALLGFAQNIWVLLLLLLLIGIGSAMFHPQALATVRSIIQGHHGLFTSIFMVGGELGRGIWPTVVSLLVVHYGLTSLWVIAIPALISIPLMYRGIPALPKRSSSIKPIKLKNHVLAVLSLVSYASIRSLTTIGIITFFPILWNLQGGSLVGGASILTTFLVVGVIGNLGGGHLADLFGRKIVLVLSGALSTILIPFLIYFTGLKLWILAGLLGIIVYATPPVTILIGQDIFPDNRSLGSGIAAGLSNGLAALMVFIIGFYVTETNIADIFLVLSGTSFLATVLAILLPKKYMKNHQFN